MRVSANCNGTLTIQANTYQEGDFELVNRVAELMVESSHGELVASSSCEQDQWIQVCSKRDNYQAALLNETYYDAKRKVLSQLQLDDPIKTKNHKLYSLPEKQRQDLCSKINTFLGVRRIMAFDSWIGYLSKTEQIEAFGFYMGNGLVKVNGEEQCISLSTSTPFGHETKNLLLISGQTGWLSYTNNRKIPIVELNLYSALDNDLAG